MILSQNELAKTVLRLRKQNKKIVTTNGVFDIIHAGHIRYLAEAKKLGDVLIALVNSDTSTKTLKGNGRPVNPETDRAEVLDALSSVDYVLVFSELDPCAILKQIKPDIHVKGGDYTLDKILENDVVEKSGGTVVLIPASPGYATTNIIRKIQQN